MTTGDNIWYTINTPTQDGYVFSMSIRGADKSIKEYHIFLHFNCQLSLLDKMIILENAFYVFYCASYTRLVAFN